MPATTSEARVFCAPGGDVGEPAGTWGIISAGRAGFVFIMIVINRELWKVSDTITRTAYAPIEYLLFINEKTWQSMARRPGSRPATLASGVVAIATTIGRG